MILVLHNVFIVSFVVSSYTQLIHTFNTILYNSFVRSRT